MPNQPSTDVPTFHKGQFLTASDLQKVVNLLTRRIVGGKGINVRSFGDRIVIEKAPANDVVIYKK